MNQLWKKLLVICKLLILGLVFALFAWLFYLYFFTCQKVTRIYDFSRRDEYISKLKPWNRLSPILQDEFGAYQELKDKIVYFDIEMPFYSKGVIAEIKYKGNLDNVELGIERLEDKFFREKAEIIKTNDFKIAKIDFQKYEISKKAGKIPFDINRQIYVKNKKTRLMINFLDWQKLDKIKIYEIKIIHQKPKLSLELFLP
ncbi:MAG: hypothetical protein AB1465_00895 [Patescibacteria group bacterium]